MVKTRIRLAPVVQCASRPQSGKVPSRRPVARCRTLRSYGDPQSHSIIPVCDTLDPHVYDRFLATAPLRDRLDLACPTSSDASPRDVLRDSASRHRVRNPGGNDDGSAGRKDGRGKGTSCTRSRGSIRTKDNAPDRKPVGGVVWETSVSAWSGGASGLLRHPPNPSRAERGQAAQRPSPRHRSPPCHSPYPS